MKTEQFYISCKTYRLMGYSAIPDIYKTAVILIPGFTHSMTDIDYFMTSVKNELVKHEYAVVQFDPFGYGDSDGELHELTLDIFKYNINSVYNWVKDNLSNDVKVFTRGINEIVLSESNINNLFSKCVCLNPIHITRMEYIKIHDALKNTTDIIDIAKWFSAMGTNIHEFMESCFYSFGAKLKNVNGQRISRTYLEKLVEFTYNSDRKSKVQYILSKDVNEIQKSYNINDLYCSIADYGLQDALSREPEWNYFIINEIIKSIVS